MGDEKQVLVTEKTYEVDKADFLVIQGFDQSKTWYNKTAGFMDTLRLIPLTNVLICIIVLCKGTVKRKFAYVCKFKPKKTNSPPKKIPPPTSSIFQTKHIGMIPTVQILCINDFPSSKILLHDLRTHKAHYRTHFVRDKRKKKHKICY